MKDVIIVEMYGMTFKFEFPTVSQLMEIDSLKQMFSSGRHENLRRSTDPSQMFTLDLIDAMSHFSVLNKDFKKLMDEKNIDDMSPREAMPIVKAYRTHYKPKFNALMADIEAELKEVTSDVPNARETA